MTTSHPNYRYIEWLSAEDIHNASKAWLSELLFIKDEHVFLLDLITVFTSGLINPKTFSSNQALINAIAKSQQNNHSLIKTLRVHENELQILVDDKDQITQEKAYIQTHKELMKSISNFLEQYKVLKTELYKVIKSIKKEQKKIIDKL